MKKSVIFFCFFIFSYVNGQNNNNSVVNISGNKTIGQLMTEGEGINYKGNYIYSSQKTGSTGFASYKTLLKKAIENIENYCNGQNLSFKIINQEKHSVPLGSGVPRAMVFFKLLNKDGSNFITKDMASEELLKLKKFLDTGIITEAEFNEKSKELKQIILN
jgi:hypothetical protein